MSQMVEEECNHAMVGIAHVKWWRGQGKDSVTLTGRGQHAGIRRLGNSNRPLVLPIGCAHDLFGSRANEDG